MMKLVSTIIISALAVTVLAVHTSTSPTSCERNLAESLDLIQNMMASIQLHFEALPNLETTTPSTTASTSAPPTTSTTPEEAIEESTEPDYYAENVIITVPISSKRTRRSAAAMTLPHPLETCRISKTLLTSILAELMSSTPNAAAFESTPQGCGTTPTNGTKTWRSCEEAIWYHIHCGFSRLKAAYTNHTHVVANFQEQVKWENVLDALTVGTSKVVTALHDDQEMHFELVAISAQLEELRATLPCMVEVIRTRIQHTVVQMVQLGQPSEAFLCFKQLNVTGDLMTSIISEAYTNSTTSSRQRGTNALNIIRFLGTLSDRPEFQAHGVIQLLSELKASGNWPSAYIQLKSLMRQFNTSACLTVGTQLHIFHLNYNLEEALKHYISEAVRLIHAGSASATFFIQNLGYNSAAFEVVVSKAYNLNNLENVLSFIRAFRSTTYSTDGLKILLTAMRSKNEDSDIKIFKLQSLYTEMSLTDQSLKSSLQASMIKVYTKWASHVMDGCYRLEEIASQHALEFKAFEVIRRGYNGSPWRAAGIAECIDKLPWILHAMNGYGGLLKKLADLGHIDTYEYMDIVGRFKDYVSSKKGHAHYAQDAVDEVKAILPPNIRAFFFNSGSCTIVSETEGECIGVTGKAYYASLVTDYRYDTYLYSDINSWDCQVKFSKRAGHLAEYMITSVKTNTFFFVSGGFRGGCGDGCRKTFFWGTPDDSDEEFNAWFKIKSYDGGSKFSLMNTHYPGAVFATGDSVLSADKGSVYETVYNPRDFWTFNC